MTDPNRHFYNNIPDTMPRTYNWLMDPLCRFVYRLLGWRFEGEIPTYKKAIVVVAPHTSNWDFIIACLAKFSLQLDASYIMKQEAFFWPFKNWLKRIGGIPIDRSQPAKIVPKVVNRIQSEEKIWVVITPEGTRKKVTKFKTGFVRIAHAADLPIIVAGLDYRRKAIVFSRVVEPSGEHETDADELYHYCRDSFVGRRPENQ